MDEPNGPTTIAATILSLDEWKVPINDDVATVLAETGDDLDAVLANMKRPPGETTCRIVGGVPMDQDQGSSVNRLEEALATIRQTLQPWLASWTIMDQEVKIALHPVLQDVVTIRIDPDPHVQRPKTRLVNSRLRRPADDSSQSGWPIDYKVIIVDRLTGEAILRGSHVYVRGVQAASSTVHVNERVAVYAAVVVVNEDHHCPILLLRGLQVSQYTGTCIFCGIGMAKKSRGDMFTHQSGLAVEMIDSVGSTLLPPKSAMMVIENNESSNHHDHNNKNNATTIMLQNLPSCLVATALASTVTHGQIVLDMCACPGGKTSHLASLLREKDCHIVACDRSRKKMQAAQDLFRRHGLADMITCLALDSRKILQPTQDGDDSQDDCSASMSLLQILQRGTVATADTNGDKNDPLRRIKGFPAGSIDHILLDPPCSALGLRPKLDVSHLTKADLDAFVRYQQHFLRTAVALLKVDGYMTYSTCTIHMAENEGMVRWLLDTFPDRLVLVDVDIPLGRPGRPASPLTDAERQMVRYFCPTDRELDTMGFFVAKFQKIMG